MLQGASETVGVEEGGIASPSEIFLLRTRLLCSSEDGGEVSVGRLIESFLTFPIHWLEIHHFWRMLNSVIGSDSLSLSIAKVQQKVIFLPDVQLVSHFIEPI